jgi:hypothetical protein
MVSVDLHVSDSAAGHPPLRALEEYALERLVEAEVARVEEHLLLCESCRQIVSELDVFAPLLQGRGRGRRSAAFVHDTEDGLIRLELQTLPGSKWAARFWGENLEGTAVLMSAGEAYGHLRRVFGDMYPAHRCTSRCGAQD